MIAQFTNVILSGKSLLVIVVFCLTALQAYSQQQDTTALPDLITDRPDQTESASVVPLKTLQIEAGLFFQKDKIGETEISYTAYPTTLIRFGILKWLELRAEGTYQQLIVKDEAKKKEKGFGPLIIGTKVKLWKQKGIRPQTAFMVMVDLPVGYDSFKPENPEAELRLLFKNELTDKLDLSYNLAYIRVNDRDIRSYSVSIATSLSDKIGLFGEVFGDKAGGDKTAHSVDAGLVFLALPNLQFDLAAGTALNSTAPDFFVLSGLSIRLPR